MPKRKEGTMRIFIVFLTLGFLTGIGEANIRDSPEKDESPHSSLVIEEYCQNYSQFIVLSDLE